MPEKKYATSKKLHGSELRGIFGGIGATSIF